MVGLYAELFFLLCLVGLFVMAWQKLARLNQGERPEPETAYSDAGGMDGGLGDGGTTLDRQERG